MPEPAPSADSGLLPQGSNPYLCLVSDTLHHECGIALIRLLKPLSYYHEKYGTAQYGIRKLYLLMEKQHNRGQDGAGVVNIKLDTDPGDEYIYRYRSIQKNAIAQIFRHIQSHFDKVAHMDKRLLDNPHWLKKNVPYAGELFLGHLRYGTFGGNSVETCHPFLRQNNWKTRNLAVAGNFNMTNVDELFNYLVALGQHPREKSDTITVMENIGHFLDEEIDALYYQYKEKGINKEKATALISENLDVAHILRRSSRDWDGGYAMTGIIGHGDAFVLRDPAGIRPAFFYHDDEVAVVASERPVIQTVFNVPADEIEEVKPGHAIVVKKNGKVMDEEIREPVRRRSCSFERIYFSRGSDAEIYRERKELGRLLCPSVLEAVDHDLENTVFSFIPNTAEVAFYGMIEGMAAHLQKIKKQRILDLGNSPDTAQLDKILAMKPRVEKIAIKDIKLRTFITNDNDRGDMVEHVYDITYGTVRPGVDNLVVIDDSIVRGTTLKNSIIRMLDRLSPKKIIIVSSAPQIRYPDCYGIDMAKIGDLIAFRAAVSLLESENSEQLLEEVLALCMAQLEMGISEMKNHVRRVYEPFSADQISARIAELVRPSDCRAELQIIYQNLDNLHQACPGHLGDWYFSGDYPTPGGNRVVSRAFVNFMQGLNQRAY